MSVRNPENIKSNARNQIEDIRKNGWPEDLSTMGGATVLLTVKGRKSGEPRTTPANYVRVNNTMYVVGSIAGLDRHPVWALNLEAALEGELELPRERWKFKARKLEGGRGPTFGRHWTTLFLCGGTSRSIVSVSSWYLN